MTEGGPAMRTNARCQMKLTYKGKLPSLNELINAGRTNKYVGAKVKRELTQDLAWIFKAQAGGMMITCFPEPARSYWMPCRWLGLYLTTRPDTCTYGPSGSRARIRVITPLSR